MNPLTQTVSQIGVISQMTNSHAQLDIARRFHAALIARDWSVICTHLTDDAHWTLPGDNMIAVPEIGADAVVE